VAILTGWMKFMGLFHIYRLGQLHLLLQTTFFISPKEALSEPFATKLRGCRVWMSRASIR
jgi:hypothetical protein